MNNQQGGWGATIVFICIKKGVRQVKQAQAPLRRGGGKIKRSRERGAQGGARNMAGGTSQAPTVPSDPPPHLPCPAPPGSARDPAGGRNKTDMEKGTGGRADRRASLLPHPPSSFMFQPSNLSTPLSSLFHSRVAFPFLPSFHFHAHPPSIEFPISYHFLCSKKFFCSGKKIPTSKEAWRRIGPFQIPP